jgi:hypothetical protein
MNQIYVEMTTTAIFASSENHLKINPDKEYWEFSDV